MTLLPRSRLFGVAANTTSSGRHMLSHMREATKKKGKNVDRCGFSRGR